MKTLLPALFLGAVLPASLAAAQETTWFMNGPERIDLAVDGTSLGVLFDEAVPEAEARARIAAMPAVAEGQAGATWYQGGKLIPLRTAPGTTASEALEAARAIGELPGVRAAGPRLLAGQEPYYVTDSLLVRYVPGVDPAAVAAVEERHGLEQRDSLRYTENPGVVYGLPAGASLEAPRISRELHATGLVEFAIPNFSVTRVPYGGAPNDPLLANQWHLHSVGQGGAKPDADVDALEAWDITTGDPSVVVAVIDTGIELGHPDLNLVQGTDVLDNDSNPQAEDGIFGGIFGFTDSHSTSVSGVIAARGNNGIGVSGASQDSRVMPIRFLSEANLFAQPVLQDEVDAMTFACSNGAAILNNSWGPLFGAPLNAATKAAIDDCVTFGRGGLGSLVVFASGNSGIDASQNGYAADPNTIAVSASTDQDLFAFYSNFGPIIDVCAPSNGGVTAGIFTTDRLGAKGYASGDYTDNFGGTSSAAPLVCGVLALTLAANPSLTWQEARQILHDTADKIDPAGGNYNAQGHSNLYGFGKVNAHEAVLAAVAMGGGGVEFYGQGLPGFHGLVPEIDASGVPAVNTPGFAATLTDGRPDSIFVLGLGIGQGSVPFAGGTILIDIFQLNFSFTIVSDPAGAGSQPLPIGPSPTLAGAELFTQWVGVDPGAVGGFSFSQGMKLTIQP